MDLDALKQTATAFVKACEDIHAQAVEAAKNVIDKPGVRRISENAFSVPASELSELNHVLGASRLNSFVLDFPRQAARIADWVGKARSQAPTALRNLQSILNDGREYGDNKGYVYAPEVVETMRPYLVMAVEISRSLQASQIVEDQMALPRRQIRHAVG